MIFAVTIPGWEQLIEGIAYVLKYMYEFTGSFGLAVILFTIAMRALLFPLTYKQTKSMIAMQRLMPQMKEIQKKYKDDREKQGQEMMALYKEHKVSPFSSCLPMVLQLPIIFAVFEVLRNLSVAGSNAMKIMGKKVTFIVFGLNLAVIGTKTGMFMFLGMDLRDAGSLLWAKGDYAQLISLVLLTVLTGYISSTMMATDQKQAKMMTMLMPPMMGVFAWILPAGVTIYIVVTNILTIGQQYFQLEREGYYDEKKRIRYKTGEPLKWMEKISFTVTDFGSSSLLALKLKPEPVKETGKKEPVKKGKSNSSTGSGTKKSASSKSKTPQKSKKSTGAASKSPKTAGSRNESKGPIQKKTAKPKSSKGTGAGDKKYPAKKKK